MDPLIRSGNILESFRDIGGETTWKSPSNIAIVKYWGKHGTQLPRNPSISLTLSKAYTKTSLRYQKKKGSGISIHFSFEGKENEGFKKRIAGFLECIEKYFPFINQLHLDIQSANSFPHSSGIASSASGMSALALCLCDIERTLFPESYSTISFKQKASFIARLGSGSASRSIYPLVSIWGKTIANKEASDLYAIDASQHISKVFKNFHDDILIVSKTRKAVSSSLGHKLMDTNIFAEKRYEQAGKNLVELTKALHDGDLEKFGYIAEQEALVLHALMMCSEPSFILMEGNTIEVIKRIRRFREETNTPIYFTLDAGPNVHVLYPESHRTSARKFIKTELKAFCENGRIIKDTIGNGPEKIN